MTNTWTVNTHGQGTDSPVHFEKVVDGNGKTFLLVDKQGSYTAIQAAVDAVLTVRDSTAVVIDGLDIDGDARGATVEGGNDFAGVVYATHRVRSKT